MNNKRRLGERRNGMMTEAKTNATNNRLACIRCGLLLDGKGLKHLGSCPDYGSSDCPITMGYEDGPELEACMSDQQRDSLWNTLYGQLT